MLKEESVPCDRCREGLHRICLRPMAVPTLLSYLKGRKKAATETFTCCDRKEFWTTQIFE